MRQAWVGNGTPEVDVGADGEGHTGAYTAYQLLYARGEAVTRTIPGESENIGRRRGGAIVTKSRWRRNVAILVATLVLAGLIWLVLFDWWTFSGTIEYQNETGVLLWVEDATGFGREVGCGWLKRTARLDLGPLPYPRETTIRWRVGTKDGEVREAILQLAGRVERRRGGMLILEYTADGTWIAFFADGHG